MPTAMPDEPFTNKFGNLEGNTMGSLNDPSKLSLHSIVPLLISWSISLLIFPKRASVYRIAAASSPSILPKLPWPSTRGYRREKSCAILTIAS